MKIRFKFGDIKYIFHKSNRRQLVVVCSMVVNAALGLSHIVLSLINMSLFLGFTGAFNIVLALGKYFALERLLRLVATDDVTRSAVEAKSINKITLCTLICSILFFCYGIVFIFFYEDASNYSFGMVIYIASAAFFKVFSFIISALVSLRKRNGVKYYIKLMSAASALLSLALTQRAILYYVAVPHAGIYSGVGNVVFGLLATAISLYMINKAEKEKRALICRGLIKTEDKQ